MDSISIKNQKISILVKIIAFVLVFALCESLVGYIVKPALFADDFKYYVHQIMDRGEPVEMIFSGGSHSERCADPDYFEEILGLTNALNISACDQSVKGMYYRIEEMIELFHPKYAIVDISNQNVFTGEFLEGKLTTCGRFLTVKGRAKYVLSDSELLRNLGLQLDSFNDRENFFEYVDREVVKDGSRHDGHMALEQALEDGGVPLTRYSETENNEFLPDSYYWYEKIVELCKKENVEIFLVSYPITMEAIYYTEDYEDRVALFEQFATEHGVPYHNLSLLKGREDTLPDSFFCDSSHTNKYGSEYTSRVYAGIIDSTLKGEDVSGLFYSSLDELKKDVKRVVSVRADIKRDGELVEADFSSLCNEGIQPVYRALLLNEDGESIAITDWTSDTHIRFNRNDYDASYSALRVESTYEGAEGAVANQNYDLNSDEED